MAPKILLADDSMTAQNMGKKILVEGGYDVVAVSNGAAALKKIAEVRPELVILDVYMPGYTGLEVCERVRGALETAHLPVVLTVGKLEPFKPEEGSRVKADGLLVKPFEATDLLAAVKKLLDRAAPAEPVVHDDTVQLDTPVATDSPSAGDARQAATLPDYEKTQKIEVPREMLAVPAMGDLLEVPPQSPVAQPPGAKAAAASAGIPAFSVERTVPEFADTSLPAFDLDLDLDEAAPAPKTASAAMPAPAEPESLPPASADSILDALMPELEVNVAAPAPDPVAPMPDVEFTSAPQAQEVAAEPLPDLEPTVLQDSIPVEVASDAALVTSPEELAQFTTKFGVDSPEETPVGLVTDLPAEQAAALTEPAPEPVVESPAEESTAPMLEQLLETELAAQPAVNVEEVEVQPEVLPEPLPEVGPGIEAVAAAEEVPLGGIEPEPVMEPAPAVPEVPTAETEALPDNAIGEAEPATSHSVPVMDTTPMTLEGSPTDVPEQAFSLEEELHRAFADTPAVTDGSEDAVSELSTSSQADEGAPVTEDVAIDQLVERLMERLKPELVAAILKELKG